MYVPQVVSAEGSIGPKLMIFGRQTGKKPQSFCYIRENFKYRTGSYLRENDVNKARED